MGRVRLEKFLWGYRSSRAPTVAVSGLPPHVQLRAFDFQVRRGGELITSTSASSMDAVWEGGGWAAKLKEAVKKSGARLTGPLTSPREPGIILTRRNSQCASARSFRLANALTVSEQPKRYFRQRL
jgi:hypothetical protein